MPASSRVLALNAGSSSLKFAVYDDAPGLPLVAKGSLSDLNDAPRLTLRVADGRADLDRPIGTSAIGGDAAVRHALAALGEAGALDRVDVVGHRIVHGGREFVAPARLDAPVIERLRTLVPLAPLHQPFCLATVAAAQAALPKAMHVGCFDTAFHAVQPRVARTYGLPRSFTDDGVIAYGFHGLSYAHIASMLAARHGPHAGGRVIVLHLGSGSSLCAMRDGRSAATTMGFSPLDGPPMGTRCGSLDPGVVLYLIQERGISAAEVSDLLYERSGWLGISGVSGEMATLLASDDPRAREAIDLFVYRCGREIGSLAAALGGVDRIVFTGGIGEHAPRIRERICRDAAWLGVVIDDARNGAGAEIVSDARSAVEVCVIGADEEQVIAAGARACRGACS